MSPTSRRLFLAAALGGAVGLRYWLYRSGTRIQTPDEPQPVREPLTAESSVFLSWQRDPTTTMTVQWLDLQDPGQPAVHYRRRGADAGAAWATQPARVTDFPLSNHKLFRAELTNLKPDGDYEFRLGATGPLHAFRTMPARATDTIRFVSGGDCGVNPFAVANCVRAAHHEPRFVILGGDLAYENGYSVATFFDFIRQCSQHLVDAKGRALPIVPCIGNHEVQGTGYGAARKEAPFFYALFDGLFPETGFATLEFGDYLSLVLLDSNHTTPVAGAQADWLGQQLQARVDHPHVIVVHHVPAYPSYRQEAECGVDARKHWVPLFDKHRVPVVLEHHDHTYKRSKLLLDEHEHPNGVLYLGDGSWGQLRSPRPADQLPLLAQTASAYQFTLHELAGDERRHRAIDHLGKLIDECRSGQRLKLTRQQRSAFSGQHSAA